MSYPAPLEFVKLAHEWLPYGGAPTDEIFVAFGLPPVEYYGRLRKAIETGAAGPIQMDLRKDLLELCENNSRR